MVDNMTVWERHYEVVFGAEFVMEWDMDQRFGLHIYKKLKDHGDKKLISCVKSSKNVLAMICRT